ncbi:phosphatase PAP2 family protein [Leptolyngbya sp. NIES-2104]|uniref:phosphatase PAP2 family protein n=1 Tax=Leptolyngbya sp. NIES-2104 TaxID=1552121 RepID=UPI0006EC6843|nr:phosphatase PAP2 family protein [Leptolyngbya sp. NIES-2104]GAP94165.1 membrane-associated phospholipid phosphatase [Leptolyngbya sp. NIES-2104]
MRSFPQFFQQLLAARWQSLLLLFLGVVLPLIVVEQFTIVVLNQGAFAWDRSILFAIHSTHNPILDRIALMITPLGVFYGVFPVSAVISIGLLYQRRWRKLTYLLVTLLGSAMINRIAKVWLHRDRPDFWDSLTPHTDFSFPSGHAMSSMTLVAVLVILAWGSRWCGWISAIGGLFVLVIAWTRLYLGVHFPSDILAGWMISLAWSIGVRLVIRPQLESSIDQTTVLPDELQSTQS